MYSLDFHPVAQLEHEQKWTELAALIIDAVSRLEKAGADFVLIASNTLHKIATEVQHSIGDIPLLHIGEVTATAILDAGISVVGLLGTNFVMEQGFYKEKLARRGIQVVIPPKAARDYVHRVIYEELCVGQLLAESKAEILRVLGDLGDRGTGAVVLANTELPLLISQEDTSVILFDSTAIHAKAAVDWALKVP
jgi:aspartate racemase